MANILLLDDSDDLLEMFAVILKMHGYTASTANSQSQFFEALGHNQPDLIILDVALRDGDGREICKAVKSNNTTGHIPILLLSANPTLLAGYKDCNADDFLEKPFDIKILTAKIQALLAG